MTIIFYSLKSGIMKESYKDILIVLLTLALLLLGSYVIISNIQSNNHNTKDTQFKENLSNLKDTEKNNLSNYSNISHNRSLFFNSTTVENKESRDNLTNNGSLLNNSSSTLNNHDIYNNSTTLNNHEAHNTTNYTANYSDSMKNYGYSARNVPISELFMNLKYSNVMPISEKQGQGIIKTYNNDNTINFDIRTYKINLDNPEYLTVSKEILHFKYGTYCKYTYTPKYTNTTESYCYYRKIGNYHIIMGFKKEDKYIRDMWLKWNEHINSVLFEN